MCKYLISPFLIFVELENRCIVAAFAICVGEKAASKQIPGKLFFKVVNVSQFGIFYAIFS
jgi:hypothetical protein